MVRRISNNDRVIGAHGDASWPCERSLIAATDAEFHLYTSLLHVSVTWHIWCYSDAGDATAGSILFGILGVLNVAFTALSLLLLLLLLLGVVGVLGIAVFVALAVLVFEVACPGTEWGLVGLTVVGLIRISGCVWRWGSTGIPDFLSVPTPFCVGGNFMRALAAGKPGSTIQIESRFINDCIRICITPLFFQVNA